jgi:hypothetical protein
MSDKYPHLRQHIPDVLEGCEERGLAPPYVVCFVGSNGCALVRRYTSFGEFEELAEHKELAPGEAATEGMALPFNVMIVDGDAKAAFATISADKGLTFHR